MVGKTQTTATKIQIHQPQKRAAKLLRAEPPPTATSPPTLGLTHHLKAFLPVSSSDCSACLQLLSQAFQSAVKGRDLVSERCSPPPPRPASSCSVHVHVLPRLLSHVQTRGGHSPVGRPSALASLSFIWRSLITALNRRPFNPAPPPPGRSSCPWPSGPTA